LAVLLSNRAFKLFLFLSHEFDILPKSLHFNRLFKIAVPLLPDGDFLTHGMDCFFLFIGRFLRQVIQVLDAGRESLDGLFEFIDLAAKRFDRYRLASRRIARAERWRIVRAGGWRAAG